VNGGRRSSAVLADAAASSDVSERRPMLAGARRSTERPTIARRLDADIDGKV
jgi:hypothetical protein